MSFNQNYFIEKKPYIRGNKNLRDPQVEAYLATVEEYIPDLFIMYSINMNDDS